MFLRQRTLNLALEAGRAATVAALCATLLAPDAFAAAAATDIPKTSHTAPLTKDEKVLHALNRLTFGPRPGEAKAVSAMGLDAWFERQLHPASIDDSAFERRLDEFPAMRLSQGDLIRQFPGPLQIRFMLSAGIEEPPAGLNPTARAVYADYIARYKIGLALQAKGGKANNLTDKSLAEITAENGSGKAPAAVPAEGMMAGGGDMSMAEPMGGKAGKKQSRANELQTAAFEKIPVSTLTPDQIRAIVQLPAQQRFEAIVAMSPADNIKFSIATAPYLGQVFEGFTPAQREIFGAMQQPIRVVSTETLGARLLRDVYSERQLQAVMTDFWLNHFSVYLRKNQFEPYLLNSYQRDVILPNSLGNFEKLLVATAESPAMLMYLDNWQSVGPDSPSALKVSRAKKAYPNAPLVQMASQGINENYARELMELHTVGVNGGYTQKDVIEVAKCFTGWTLNRPYGGAHGAGTEDEPQAFRFDPSKHAAGPKVVMGVTIPEGGMQEGLTVLHMLATSPRTAHFISQKLAVRFVSDDPSKALVDRMAATFTKTNGDIAAVLSTMFHSPEFWSPAVYRAKVKTPQEFMVSALRASNANIDAPGLLVQAVEQLGMPVYGMQTPNGYSWQSSDWVSTGALVNRMNFALVLSGDHVRGTTTKWTSLLGDSTDSSIATSPTPQTEKALEYLILGEPASNHTRETVLKQFNDPEAQKQAQKNFAITEPAAEPENDMAGTSGRPKRYAVGKASQAAQGGNFSLQNTKPETPLDTMAGLLIGSPDFQRR